jgi:large subunit ribosomal protein L9
MKVILKQDYKGLGKNESLVEVNDGFARNFLIPRGIAVEANPSNISVMRNRSAAELSQKKKEETNAKKLSGILEGAALEIPSKAGENGKLFGSVTAKDISDAIRQKFDIDIDKRKIIMEDTIKSLGEYKIAVKLHSGVDTQLMVKITRLL